MGDRLKSLEHLEILNRKSVELAFGLEDLDWSLPVDRGKHWAPDHLGPLCYLPAYSLLSAEEKRRYNQLYAIGMCEQFIWLEEQVLIRLLVRVLQGSRFPRPLSEAIRHFIVEERKHTSMFWRILEKSEPTWYPTRRFKLFNVSPLQHLLLYGIIKNPRLFLVWIWMAIFFEERTVFFARHYIKARHRSPGQIDAVHTQLHEYHLKDEARHCQLDQYLIKHLYDHKPQWKKLICAKMFYCVMRQYIFPRRTTRSILHVLGHEFPSLKENIIPQLLKQLPQVGLNHEFHEMLFNRRATPRSMKLFAEYPEHDGLWDLFLAEQKNIGTEEATNVMTTELETMVKL